MSSSVPPAALKLDAPKLDSRRARNKLSTWKENTDIHLCNEYNAVTSQYFAKPSIQWEKGNLHKTNTVLAAFKNASLWPDVRLLACCHTVVSGLLQVSQKYYLTYLAPKAKDVKVCSSICAGNKQCLIAYHQVADDHGGQEEWYADIWGHQHTVPHRFNPFTTQNTEDDHEAVHKVDKVPAGHFLGRKAIYVVWRREMMGAKNPCLRLKQ